MSRFQALALEDECENIQAYKSSTLKRHLIQECSEIVFIPKPGMSDLVCDATISLGDALKKIGTLVCLNNEPLDEQLTVQDESDMNDESVIHAAVGIFCRRMQAVRPNAGQDEYFSFDDMTVPKRLC